MHDQAACGSEVWHNKEKRFILTYKDKLKDDTEQKVLFWKSSQFLMALQFCCNLKYCVAHREGRKPAKKHKDS